MNRKLFTAFICTATLTLAAGCGQGELCGEACGPDSDPPVEVDPETDPEIEEGMTALRVVHASPDAPAIDVWIEGADAPIIENLSYGDDTDYAMVASDNYPIALRVSPSTANDTPVYEGWLNLESQHRTTTIAAGLIGSAASADKFRILKVDEGFGPADNGSAIMRVVHAGADAPTVGIDLHDDDPTAPEISGLDRFTSSDAAGFAINAGEVQQVGITASGGRVTAFTTPELPGGAELFVIATGLTGKLAREQDGFALLAVGPEGSLGFIRQNPVVYALHGSPDAPPVDGFVGETELFSLSFGELSDGIQVPPGAYDVDFYPASPGVERPDGDPAVSANTQSLEPGERYLTIATGLLSGAPNAFQLQSYAEGFDLGDPDASRVRVVHSSPDAPAVDLGIVNIEQTVSPLLVTNVSFPEATSPDGLDTGIGQIPLGVTPAGANDQVVASFHVTTAPGLRAFGIAAGALDPSNGASFRLLVVDTAVSPWSVATVHPQP